MKSKLPVLVLFLTFFPVRDVCAQNAYYLPHVANGNFGSVSFRTTFILFNNSDSSVTAILSLTDNSGSALTTTIGGLGTGSQFVINLDGGATGFLQTDGLGAGAVGAATVNATAAIGVSAIFTVYDANGNYLTEAGVGSSALLTQFVLPVDSTGSFLTGLALFNPGVDATLTLTLLNTDGSRAGSTTQQLMGGSHIATFLAAAGQLFPAISNFRGTLLVQSSLPIAALVLRQYQTTSMLSYTSLPVVPQSTSKSILNLAHVANGSYGSISFRMSFLVFNVSAAPADVTLTLTKDDGSPFTVTIPGNGAGTGTNSSFSFTLAPRGSIFLQTDGSGAGTSGAATLTSSMPVGASSIFTVLDSKGQFQTEAGVGNAALMSSFTLPVDITGSFDTGVAFFNPGSTVLTVALKLMDSNGVLVSSTTRSLSAKGHLATFVDNLFTGLIGFRGSLAVSATGGLAATTLRQYASGATYTTLPTSSGASSGKTQVSPLLPVTVTGLNAVAGDPDVALSERLPQGSLISGTITGAGRGLLVVASAGGNNIYSGSVNPLTGRYLIVVPDGTYNLTAYYQPNGAPNTMSLTVSYSDPDPVQVVFDAVRDIPLPAVALFDISGTVSGVSILPAAPGVTVVFTSGDNRVQGQFSGDLSGNYQGVLPAGSYSASVSASPIQLSPVQSETLQLFNLGSLTVAGGPASGNYTIPQTARLSGTIGGGGFSALPPGNIVSAADASAPSTSQLTCCPNPAESTSTAGTTGLYQMILARDRTYAARVEIPVSLTAGIFDTIYYPVAPGKVSLSTDTTLDFNIPGVVRRVQIFGNVNDGLGHVLPNVVVTAYSESITGAANVGFSSSTITDVYGNYRVLVPGGTNFRVTFEPPAPKP